MEKNVDLNDLLKVELPLHDVRYPALMPLRELVKKQGWSIEAFAEILENKGFFDTYTYLYDVLNLCERRKMLLNASFYFLIGEFAPSAEQEQIFHELLSEYTE